MVQFFRDPVRINPNLMPEDILSPADGVIFEIDTQSESGTTIIRIRMRFWDVHVNYIPLSGELLSKTRIKGKLLPILPWVNNLSKNHNSRQILEFSSHLGFKFKVVQISGLLAYRTVSYIKEKDKLNRSDKIGMIRFGSETDFHIPTNFFSVSCKVGDKVKAGKSIIGQLKSVN